MRSSGNAQKYVEVMVIRALFRFLDMSVILKELIVVLVKINGMNGGRGNMVEEVLSLGLVRVDLGIDIL